MGIQADWSVIERFFPLFMEGMMLTLVISALALLLSVPIGVALGLARLSRNRAISFLATAYIELVRGIPLLVLLFWIYFVLGKALQLGAYWSAVLGLAIFSGAFVAEIIRAGVQAVPTGQMEAARSSGMSHVQAMRYIIFPQAIRNILPPLASQFILLIKDSSLVSVISVVDLTLVAKNTVATSFKAMEVWTFVGLLYFVMTFTLSQIIRLIEKRTQRREGRT